MSADTATSSMPNILHYYQYHRYNSFALHFTCSHWKTGLSIVAMSHSHDAVTFVVEGVQLQIMMLYREQPWKLFFLWKNQCRHLIIRRLVELLHGLEVEAAVEEVDQVGVIPDYNVPPVLHNVKVRAAKSSLKKVHPKVRNHGDGPN